MKCIICGNEMVEKVISRKFQGKVVHNINALVCEQCGEIYFSQDEAKRIEQELNRVKDELTSS